MTSSDKIYNSLARISGAALIIWTCVYSKAYGLYDPGNIQGLIAFIGPLFIVHWLAKQANFTQEPVKIWPYPLLPVLIVTGSMLVSAILNRQYILHAMGPSRWIWVTCIIVVASHWKPEFIKQICKMAFILYIPNAILHWGYFVDAFSFLPPSPIRENANLLSVQLACLGLLAFMDHKSPLTKNLIWLFIAVTMYFMDSIAGLGAFLFALLCFSKNRKYIFIGAGIIGVAGLVLKYATSNSPFLLRKQILEAGLEQALHNPLYGIGYGKLITVPIRPGLYITHPHNMFLNFLRLTGVIGLAAFINLLMQIYKSKNLITRRGQSVIVFLLVWSLVDDYFVWYGPLMFFTLACIPSTSSSKG